MTYDPEPICWCGHRRSVHEHYRDEGLPTDCGYCGLPPAGDPSAPGCLMFTPYRRWRDKDTGAVHESEPFNEAQRRAGQAADRALLRNILALAPFAVSVPDPNTLPVPRQRGSTSLAGFYRRTVIEGMRRRGR